MHLQFKDICKVILWKLQPLYFHIHNLKIMRNVASLFRFSLLYKNTYDKKTMKTFHIDTFEDKHIHSLKS